MNKDIYFSMAIESAAAAKRGLVVRIPAEPGRLPGELIKALTETGRGFAQENGAKLRTEMLVAPLPRLALHTLEDFLWGDHTLNSARLQRHLADYFAGRVPHRFQPKVGMTVVMEEEFIGRARPLATLEEQLLNRRSCHLRAPRRYGKSSLMGRLAAKHEHAVMLELSDVGTLSGYFKMLLRSCMRHPIARPVLHALPPYRSWPDITNQATFSQTFNAAFAELLDRRHGPAQKELVRETMTALADSGIVLLVDEFSLFLRDMHEMHSNELQQFLLDFQRLRTRADRRLTAVFAGSAGLSTFIELYGMRDLFEDLVPVDVPPVTAAEAHLLAEELLYGMEKIPTPAVLDRMVALTGNDDSVPYFVQALAAYTAEQTGQRREVTVADAEQAYYDRLLGPAGNVCFRDFILRERSYPGDYRKCASPILKQLSQRAPDSIAKDELRRFCTAGCEFEKLMTCLEEDYDLVREGNAWRMRSRVIADRWRLGEPWLTVGGH